MITGIMSAHAPNPSFESMMTDLELQARNSSSMLDHAIIEPVEEQLPQVHALNGLREVFKDSNVRKRAEGHVLKCLHIASEALNSETYVMLPMQTFLMSF